MSAIYRCQQCGCVSDISNSLSAFEENPHCHQCGLSMSESDLKMQDELASMMARNLHLGAVEAQPDTNMSSPPTPQVVPQAAPITYITQHYHHSAHVVPTVPIESQVAAYLEKAGINASALLPTQLQLFRNAQPDQQQRLIELWRISPPMDGYQRAGNGNNWAQTSMEQEEAAAHGRWLQKQSEHQSSTLTQQQQETRSSAEPYMEHGYQNLPNVNGVTAPSEYKSSTDPAYQHSREWWQMDGQPMEHQYGMLQQMTHY